MPYICYYFHFGFISLKSPALIAFKNARDLRPTKRMVLMSLSEMNYALAEICLQLLSFAECRREHKNDKQRLLPRESNVGSRLAIFNICNLRAIQLFRICAVNLVVFALSVSIRTSRQNVDCIYVRTIY